MTIKEVYFHCQCCNNLLRPHEVDSGEKYCSTCLGDSSTLDEDDGVFTGDDNEEDV